MAPDVWGHVGSGILLERDGEVFLGLRSEEVAHPLTWGAPGGQVPFELRDRLEDIHKSAVTEFKEEVGSPPPGKYSGRYARRRTEVHDFYLFLYHTKLDPEVNPYAAGAWENEEFAWFPVDNLPEDVIPGLLEEIQELLPHTIGSPSDTPYDLAADPQWDDIFYGEPSEASVKRLATFLRKNPNLTLRLYHGTGASAPVMEQGLRPTSKTRRRSLQSRAGYVSLSVYPGMAESFGKMGYPGQEVAVYAVDVPVSSLSPDVDQLRNQRQWAGRDVKNTLVQSLAYGHGAQHRGSIPPEQIQPVSSTTQGPSEKLPGVLRSLTKAYEKFESVQESAWPACWKVSEEIVAWLSKKGLAPLVVQGWLDGNEEHYHYWVTVEINGRGWIVDGTRNQFEFLTGDGRHLAIIPEGGQYWEEYQTEVAGEVGGRRHDIAVLTQAREIANGIVRWFKDHDWKEHLKPVRLVPGPTGMGYAVQVAQGVPPGHVLFLVLARKDDPKIQSGYGTMGGSSIIVLKVLDERELDNPYLDSWIGGGGRTALEHELIHFLDKVRGVEAPPSARFIDDLPVTTPGDEPWSEEEGRRRYFNDPQEMNAFYGEVATSMVNMWRSNPLIREKLSDPREFRRAFVSLLSDEFWESLTPKNRQRIEKRIYQLLTNLKETPVEPATTSGPQWKAFNEHNVRKIAEYVRNGCRKRMEPLGNCSYYTRALVDELRKAGFPAKHVLGIVRLDGSYTDHWGGNIDWAKDNDNWIYHQFAMVGDWVIDIAADQINALIEAPMERIPPVFIRRFSALDDNLPGRNYPRYQGEVDGKPKVIGGPPVKGKKTPSVGDRVRAQGVSSSDLGEWLGAPPVEGIWLGDNRIYKNRKVYPVQASTVVLVKKGTTRDRARAKEVQERLQAKREASVQQRKDEEKQNAERMRQVLAILTNSGLKQKGDAFEVRGKAAVQEKGRVALDALMAKGYKLTRYGGLAMKGWPTLYVHREEAADGYPKLLRFTFAGHVVGGAGTSTKGIVVDTRSGWKGTVEELELVFLEYPEVHMVTVIAYPPGLTAAQKEKHSGLALADFTIRGGRAAADRSDIVVFDEHNRRKGVMRRIYDEFERRYGVSVDPYSDPTEEGHAFQKSRRTGTPPVKGFAPDPQLVETLNYAQLYHGSTPEDGDWPEGLESFGGLYVTSLEWLASTYASNIGGKGDLHTITLKPGVQLALDEDEFGWGDMVRTWMSSPAVGHYGKFVLSDSLRTALRAAGALGQIKEEIQSLHQQVQGGSIGRRGEEWPLSRLRPYVADWATRYTGPALHGWVKTGGASRTLPKLRILNQQFSAEPPLS